MRILLQVLLSGAAFVPARGFMSTSPVSSVMSMSSSAAAVSCSILPEETLDSLLAVAIEASRLAGDIIIGNKSGADVTKTKANPKDLLTLIDPLCEKTIREAVEKSFPDHDFLGEEDVPAGAEASAAAIQSKLDNAKSDYLWVVDPIDGTSNFVHGMPLNCPSVACAYKGEVVVAVIHDPHRSETFTATKGRGSFLNGERIRVGEQSTIGDAIVAMGSPPAEESMQMSLKALPVLMPRCRTIRMIGSAAIMLAWVANGRLTAYWEYDLSSWDVAAGSLLIEEAGGAMTDLQNNRWTLTTRKICGSNGGDVHRDILASLEEAGVS